MTLELKEGAIYRVMLSNNRVFCAKYDGKDNYGRYRFISSKGTTTWHKESNFVFVDQISE